MYLSLFFRSLRVRFLSVTSTLVVGLLVTTAPIHSAPSSGNEQLVLQPDGTAFTVVQRGDEWNNWSETASGFAVAKSADGYWRYVESYAGSAPVLSSVLTEHEAPSNLVRNLRPKLQPTSGARLDPFRAQSVAPNAVPTSGNFSGRLLYILAEFDDRAGLTLESSWADNLSNDVANYFDAASYGKVQLLPAAESFGAANNGVIGWVNVGASHPNTGRNTGSLNRDLTRDAILAADPYIDYAAYDIDNSGLVDVNELAIVVIVAGYETSASITSSPSVWGHKWSIPPGVQVDGVKVGHYNYSTGVGGYAQFGELHNTHQATLGIQVHELGHLLFALPDLYDIDLTSLGIGSFGLMSYGSWGRKSGDYYNGQTPVLPSAWAQLQLGWVTALEGVGEVSIDAAGTTGGNGNGVVYRASTTNPEQYFLLQNRRNVGYDRGLGRFLGYSFAGGLNIFHVDESQFRNSNDLRRLVDVEEADGSQMANDDYGRNSDLWVASSAANFNKTTLPDSRLNDGANSGVVISGISASGLTMSATFSSEFTPPTAAFTVQTSVSSRSVYFDGSASTDTDGFIESYSWDFGDGQTGSGVSPNHIYDADGTYVVELRVTDDDSTHNAITQNVIVDTGDRVDVVAFDLVDLSRPEGGKYQNELTIPANATDLRFSMSGGGGEADLYVREGSRPTKAVYDCRPFQVANLEECLFATPVPSATYYFAIRARSPGYAGVDIKVSYLVGGSANQPPKAAFAATSLAGSSEVSFDASASSDPDGSVALYDWDFGDDTSGGGVMPTHTYAEEGTYVVELTVTDNNGVSDSTTQNVTVTTTTSGQVVVALEEFNIARILKAKYRNEITVPAGATDLRFSITGGTGEADLYVREGARPTQGTYDCRPYLVGNSEDCVVATPDSSSIYHLTIRARSAFTGVSIRVTYSLGGGSDNQLPTAAFTSTLLSTPRAVDFDGSASSDPDGPIASYTWDFGDGETGSGVMPSHTYALDGTYAVELTVTDDVGASNSTMQSVTVTTPGEGEMVVAFEEIDIAREVGDRYRGEVVLPAGASDLRITISGGTGSGGAADLYVREGDKRPTLSVYDCRPYLNGNDEECVFVSPVPLGRYNFTIRARRAFAGLTVRVTYRLSSGTN